MKKFIVALLALGLLFGCSNEQSTNKSSNNNSSETVNKKEKAEIVTVVISKNNGEEMIEEKEIEIATDKEVTVMDIMQENFEIETQFDGAFVASINGIAGSDEDKTSWFYSVNGEEAMVGANEYKVEPEDKIEFDLHKWE
ncbi:DUF4430 domain-containing protein [Bacillus timonensis]|uniref:DUF4430 domain-containing protein n=1 Tax=Bacillus timonensis TaxID=1033734 RepID=A0A4V3V8G2_9BACI|nr:DUF4430 domain-containing protein [Bacillus timonensis]THE15043.1 DUF4430 domain-containing protein [Bacillus timonensis]